MSTRPDWAMDRAAAILATLYTQLSPSEKLNYFADLLVTSRLEGEIAATTKSTQSIDAAFRRHMQAAE